MLITQDQILKIAPKTKPADLAKFFPYLEPNLKRYGIITPQRIAAFISNVAEESANFHRALEYASGAAYENRKDLGNIYIGDGVRFRGRGLIQLTGRNIYRAFSLAVLGNDMAVTKPELLEHFDLAVESACWFWKMKDLNHIADFPETWIKPGAHGYTKFQWITVLINGGLNGYAERLANYQRARVILKF